VEYKFLKLRSSRDDIASLYVEFEQAMDDEQLLLHDVIHFSVNLDRLRTCRHVPNCALMFKLEFLEARLCC